LVAAALEANGIDLRDVTSIALGAADAAFAFDGGNIDAWAVWDPYLTVARRQNRTRVIAWQGDILRDNAGFLLANATFAKAYPEHVRALVEGSVEAGLWARGHLDEVTTALAAATGMKPDVVAEVNRNAGFEVGPLTAPILDAQQRTADRLMRLGVIPRAVKVRDVVWTGAAAS
jgi:sulfonate transport system substrate-binding protein